MPSPVVLVHALGTSPSEWDAVAAALDAAGHEVADPELPAHGARRSEPFRFGSAVGAVIDAADGFDEPAVIVGRQLGGHLAIAAAATLDPSAPPRAVVAAGIGTEVLGWVLDSYRIASAVTALLPDRGASIGAWAGDSVLDRGSARADGSTILGEALDDVARFHVRGALAGIRSPFVLANGSRDRFRMQERALLRAARDSRLVRMPGEALADRIGDAAAFARLIQQVAGDLPETR